MIIALNFPISYPKVWCRHGTGSTILSGALHKPSAQNSCHGAQRGMLFGTGWIVREGHHPAPSREHRGCVVGKGPCPGLGRRPFYGAGVAWTPLGEGRGPWGHPPCNEVDELKALRGWIITPQRSRATASIFSFVLMPLLFEIRKKEEKITI